jgi:hypothetical protein
VSKILTEVLWFFPELGDRTFISDVVPLLRVYLPDSETLDNKESKVDLRSKYCSGLKSETAKLKTCGGSVN